MDLANLASAPTLVTIGDREYWVGPLSYLSLGTLQRWLNGHCDDPPRIGKDSNWPSVLFGETAGVEFFVTVLFSVHQELKEDDLPHILGHMGPKQLGYLFNIAMEMDPKEGGGPDPKATAGASIG